MRKFGIRIAVVLGLIISVMFGWKLAFPTNTFRYKVIVNVETPEGQKSGSAVREVTIFQQPKVGDSGPGSFARGEAVAVDLGKRGVLFALIYFDDKYLVFRTFDGPGGLTRKGARYYEQLKAKATLAPINYPLLVAFKDINDPKTVAVAYKPVTEETGNGLERRVIGAEDHMAELFGPGVRLKDITIEMTDEPVTWGIGKILNWVDDQKIKGGTLSGKAFFQSIPSPEQVLTADNFKQGNK